ncbi:hypothetical protein Peur_051630 [Populus x canadensis]
MLVPCMSSSFRLTMLIHFSHKSLPKPVLPPHFIHLLKRRILGFWQQVVHEGSHHNNPSPKEEENPRFEVAKHGQKGLRDNESEEKAHCNHKTLPC